MEPLVEIAIPVFNEEQVLEASVRRLHGFLAASVPYAFRIVVADNARRGLDARYRRAAGR